MQNGTRTDESDAGNNLRGYSRVVRGRLSQTSRKHSKQRRAEADEHVGAKAGATMLEFPLQSNDPAEQCGQHQPRDRARNDTARHLAMHQVDDVLPVHGFNQKPGVSFKWLNFIIGSRSPQALALTRLITWHDREPLAAGW